MSDGRTLGPLPTLDATEQARRAAERLFGEKSDSTAARGSATPRTLNSLDVLRNQVLGRPSLSGVYVPITPISSGFGKQAERQPEKQADQQPDKQPEKQADKPSDQARKVPLKINYGDPDFDAKLAQTDYSKVIITGVPKELSPAPWIDDQTGKGFFFWFKNPKDPANSDRSKHYFPSNLKQIEIAQYQGSAYKPILINADEMRIAASQAYMRQQNDSGYGSYKSTTDAFSYAVNMSKIASQALQYQEQLMREGAKNSPTNPYFHIYLADILTAQAVQPVVEAITSGKTAYFDNPLTNKKIDEALNEVRAATAITRKYGNLVKPPDHETPLSPFGLNPYAYNPDFYWSGAAYQAAIREVQLTFLKQAVVLGKLPLQLPPELPPKP